MNNLNKLLGKLKEKMKEQGITTPQKDTKPVIADDKKVNKPIYQNKTDSLVEDNAKDNSLSRVAQIYKQRTRR